MGTVGNAVRCRAGVVTSETVLPTTDTTIATTVASDTAVVPTLAVSTPPAPAPTTLVDLNARFNKQNVLRYGGRIVEDIHYLDQKASAGDPFGLANYLSLLKTDFTELSAADVPPRVDRVQYLSRLTALAGLCDTAQSAYNGGDDTTLIAAYQVIRQHSVEVLTDINHAYGASLHV